MAALPGIACWWSLRRNTNALFVPPSGGGKAINQAIAKYGSDGGEVRLGPGMYACSDPIVIRCSNVTLRGAGASTLLKLAANANCPVVIVGDEAREPRGEVSNVRISDLRIDGNRTQQHGECWNGKCDTGESTVIRSCGIVVRRAVDVLVERVSIMRCRSAGLVTEKGCRRITVRQFASGENEFDGLACYQTVESLFADLHLHGNRNAGISVDMQFDGNLVTNAFLARNGTQGIFMRDSSNNIFQGLVISESGAQGVFLSQVDGKPETGASGNSFMGLIVANSRGPGIRINSASCRHTLIAGCQFFGNEAGLSEATPGLVEIHAALSH